jgi:AAA+ ATPase superfamily predicted ATPase
MISDFSYFKDREIEAKALRDRINSPHFEYIIFYGRRRVGKTELIKFCSAGNPTFYYFAHETNNLGFIYEDVAARYPEIRTYTPSWKTLIQFLMNRVKIFIIDEVQNLFKEDPDIGNFFAEIIDDIQHSPSTFKIIMAGSSVSLMTSAILTHPSPLFGRKTWSLKLLPIKFHDLPLFFPGRPFQELCEIYGFADGIPYYMNQITDSFWAWMENGLKTPGWFPIEEIDFLLKIELHDINIHKLILYAIGTGHTTMNDIRQFLAQQGVGEGIQRGLSSYIHNLIEIDLIFRQTPITDAPDSRSGRYYLKDNFLKFWFRFIFPNLSPIQFGTLPVEAIHQKYSEYMGLIFEGIVREFLIQHPLIPFTYIGRWWGRQRKRIANRWHSTVEEIDLVAFSHEHPEVLAVECKWQQNVNPYAIAQSLKDKVGAISFPDSNKPKKFTFAIFALTFMPNFMDLEIDLEGIRVICYNLTRLDREYFNENGFR